MNISHARRRYLVTALAIAGTCLVLNRTGDCAEPTDAGDDQGVEVQTRGPVHEAFAGVVTFNPEPGVIVAKTPPPAIEEVPPDEKPAGDNVAWIPGYWGWDDERHDFLWISGVWRALPPGRQWLPGYWAQANQGSQWISGYWADAKVTQTTYLPPPPATLERGPNLDPPSPDYFWAPGSWVWYDSRYAWRPGYWVLGRSDWDWCPAYYSYTPRGYVYVDGYWDYNIGFRGVLFAPVYFSGGYYARPGYYYSPSIVINLAVFPDHLFIRPSYCHYYFGDYYAASYSRGGFYASFSYQSRRHGYDPIYSHQRWEHRNDRGWESHVATTYKYRREHEDARPPRTWAAETKMSARAESKDHSLAVATSYKQLTSRKDSPVRYQPVAPDRKQQIVQRNQEVRQSGDQRRTVESQVAPESRGKSGKNFQPTTAKLPQSPLASQPYDRSTQDQPTQDRSPRDRSPRDQPTQDRSTTKSQPGPRRDSHTEIIRGNSPADANVNKNYRHPEPPKSDYRDKPVYPQPSPQAQQPAKHEGKSDPGPSSNDQPRDKGNARGNGNDKGNRNADDRGNARGNGRDDDQSGQPGR